jgi:hypothetical protein
MRPPAFDPRSMVSNALAYAGRWVPRIAPTMSASTQAALRWTAHHSGLPVVLVGAISLVLSWRILKRALRLTVEVVIALTLLIVATHLGWLRW